MDNFKFNFPSRGQLQSLSMPRGFFSILPLLLECCAEIILNKRKLINTSNQRAAPLMLGTDSPEFGGRGHGLSLNCNFKNMLNKHKLFDTLLGTDCPIFLATDSPKTFLAQKRPIHWKGRMAKKRTSIFFQNGRSIATHKHAFRK